ncbi:uncharacterized protein LOC144108544 [Amblyomma americanum]
MYAVVRFVEGNSVAVVPTNWLLDNDTKCSWPTSKKYDKARQKLRKAEDTDHLETSTDQGAKPHSSTAVTLFC